MIPRIIVVADFGGIDFTVNTRSRIFNLMLLFVVKRWHIGAPSFEFTNGKYVPYSYQLGPIYPNWGKRYYIPERIQGIVIGWAHHRKWLHRGKYPRVLMEDHPATMTEVYRDGHWEWDIKSPPIGDFNPDNCTTRSYTKERDAEIDYDKYVTWLTEIGH